LQEVKVAETGSFSVEIILEQLLVIACIALIALFSAVKKYRAENKYLYEKYRQLKFGSPKEPQGSVFSEAETPLQYLQRQVHGSHVRLRNLDEEGAEERTLWVMRKFYLQAEVQALSKESEGSERYWSVLYKELQHLLLKLRSANPADQDAVYWRGQIAVLRDRLASMRQVKKDKHLAEERLLRAKDTIEQLEKLVDVAGVSHSTVQQLRAMNGQLSLHREDPPAEVELENQSSKTVVALSGRMSRQCELIAELKSKLGEFAQNTDSDGRGLYQLEMQGLLLQVDGLESGLEGSGQHVETLQRTISALRQQRDPERPPLTLVKGGGSSDVRIFEHQQGGDKESLYEVAGEEISKLTGIIERQKKNLNRFSDELSVLRLEVLSKSASGTVDDETLRRVGNLEQLLRESEGCVVILEGELDRLQAQLALLDEGVNNGSLESEDSASLVEGLHHELESLGNLLQNTMAAYADQAYLTQFAMQAVDSGSISELGKCLLDTLASLKLTAALCLYGTEGKVELLGGRSHSTAATLLLRRLDPLSKQRFHEAEGLQGITFANLVCVFPSSEIDASRAQELKDFVATLLSLATVFIEKVDSSCVIERQAKSMNHLLQSAHKTIMNLDVQYSYQVTEANRNVDRLLKELRLAVDAMGLRKDDLMIFHTMMADCQERMALLFASGISVDETMEQLLRSLEQQR